MVFNIGSQQAGVVNNVTGDQHVHGGQHAAVSMNAADLQALLAHLRAEVGHARLPRDAHTEAVAAIDAAAAELGQAQPDRRTVAARLTRLAQTLAAAGALATASTGLGGALATLAGWLGTLGEPIRQILNR